MTLEERARDIADSGYNLESIAGRAGLRQLAIEHLRDAVTEERERCAAVARRRHADSGCTCDHCDAARDIEKGIRTGGEQ
jgi:hypothetical protein